MGLVFSWYAQKTWGCGIRGHPSGNNKVHIEELPTRALEASSGTAR